METKNSHLQEDEKIVAAGKDNPANAEPAHNAAEEDMANDPDMIMDPEEGDDLDEGELAKLDGTE